MYKAVRMFHYQDGIGLEQEALKGVCEVEEHVCSTEEDIIQYCKDADTVMGIFEPLTARVINSLPKLKLIACKSMGYNYVDLDAAKARGISVTHLRSAFASTLSSKGLAMCSFMPTVFAACTSSAKALAVMATMGTRRQYSRSMARMARVAS